MPLPPRGLHPARQGQAQLSQPEGWSRYQGELITTDEEQPLLGLCCPSCFAAEAAIDFQWSGTMMGENCAWVLGEAQI